MHPTRIRAGIYRLSGQTYSTIRASSKDERTVHEPYETDSNFRSGKTGRSAAIKAAYRNYRCRISDVSSCYLYMPYAVDQNWRGITAFVSYGPWET